MAEQNIPSVINVPSEAPPSIVNEGTLTGAVWGSVVGMPILGGIMGSFFGKKDMEREYREGHQVLEPGSKAATVTAGLVMGAILGLMVAAPAALVVSAGAALVAGTVIGAVIGGLFGNSQHNSQVQEYESAKRYYSEHGGNYMGREREAQKASNITKDDLHQINERLAAMEQKSFGDRVRTSQAAAQTTER